MRKSSPWRAAAFVGLVGRLSYHNTRSYLLTLVLSPREPLRVEIPRYVFLLNDKALHRGPPDLALTPKV